MMCTEPLIHKGSLEETKTCPYPTNYCPTTCRMLAFIPCRFIKILVGKQSVYANQNIRRWEFQSQSRPRKIWREMWCRFLLKQCILCLWVCCYGHCIQVLGQAVSASRHISRLLHTMNRSLLWHSAHRIPQLLIYFCYIQVERIFSRGLSTRSDCDRLREVKIKIKIKINYYLVLSFVVRKSDN